MSRISVLVPVYNVAPYLKRCVESLLAQTYTDFEVLLVDDGSTDGSSAICDEYSVKDERIHVIHQENRGLATVRNVGVDWSKSRAASEYVTFVDSDDWVEPDYLNELAKGVATGSEVACVGHASVDSRGYRSRQFVESDWRVVAAEDYIVSDDTFARVSAWGKLYRKDLFDGVRYPDGRIMEDAFTTPIVIAKAAKVAMCEKALYNYYLGSPSILRSAWSKKKLDAVEAFDTVQRYFNEIGFRRAAVWARRQKLTVMAIAIPDLAQVDTALAENYRAEIDAAIENGELPFWESRMLYRAMGVRCYPLRWFLGMLGNFLKKREKSWLVRESWPILMSLIRR